MDDPILPNDPQQPAAPAPQAPAPDARLDRLEAAMQQLATTVEQAAARVTSIPAAPSAPKTSEDFLNELATDPQGVISRVAQETFQRTADATLNPAVLQVIDMGTKQLLSLHQAQVDARFGDGTFDELFRPQLEKDVAQLKQVNPRAAADPATMEALVNRLYGGDNYDKLQERQRSLQTMEDRGLTHLLPRGGVPRLRTLTGDELPQDVETFIREVERATGETIDRKNYAKLYYTGQESGPGRHRTSIVDYLKATNADPEVLKMYGSGPTS